MIYLDNSATTYPKPATVINSFCESMQLYGANAGRGFYDMSIKTTEQIFYVRTKIANLFSSNVPENVIFTYNCTMALNLAIKGVARERAHFIISDLEHNSVLRTVEKLKESGKCTYSIARIEKSDEKTILNFKKCIKPNTVAIVCTGASNVFGIVTPFRKLGKLAHENNILFILDASQIAGILPIDIDRDNIDILCAAGHKGLYGPSGTGIMIVNTDFILNTIVEGGTGSNSFMREQPDVLPDRFESGTPNVTGIIALGKGIDFINKMGLDKIYSHEKFLIDYIGENLSGNSKIKLYNRGFEKYVPILSFNIKNYHSEEVASYLSKKNIAVRAGLHCAPLAHEKMSTIDTGTVRVSPSIFSRKKDADFLIKMCFKICKMN